MSSFRLQSVLGGVGLALVLVPPALCTPITLALPGLSSSNGSRSGSSTTEAAGRGNPAAPGQPAGAQPGGQVASDPLVGDMLAGDAGRIYYAGNYREAWLSSSVGGYIVGNVTGTPKAEDVSTLFGTPFVRAGERTSPGVDAPYFGVGLNPGAGWDAGPLTGTWWIDASFWSTYGRAVISMHVGNGGGDPDWFLWEVAPHQTSGTFHYARVDGHGGGLSNLFLWGGGTPTSVPDSGATAGLLAAGLAVMTVGRSIRRTR